MYKNTHQPIQTLSDDKTSFNWQKLFCPIEPESLYFTAAAAVKNQRIGFESQGFLFQGSGATIACLSVSEQTKKY